MTTSVRVLPTLYQGVQFRGRTEARWAVVFDALGVHWDYEPEGFDVNGRWYLPDFLIRLGTRNAWFEVKPDDAPVYDHPDYATWEALALATETPLYLARGLPRLNDDLIHDTSLHEVGTGDFDHFCVCEEHPDVAGIEYEGRGDRVACPRKHTQPRYDRGHTFDHPRVLAAYQRARGYSFTGAPRA